MHRKIVIFKTGLGLGDVLLSTSIIKAWHRINRYDLLIVQTRFPELFKGNPDIRFSFHEDRRKSLESLFGKALIWRLGSYFNRMLENNEVKIIYPFPCANRHLMDGMADELGIELLDSERKPFVYLTEYEKNESGWARDHVVVQSTSTSYWTLNKGWIEGRMNELTARIRARGLNVIQLGDAKDEKLDDVIDMRGKTGLRESAAILSNAKLLIGLEGGLAHLARAVNCPAIIIYTGYTKPVETGYSENINIRSDKAGESCWKREYCDHCRISAGDISVENVFSEFEKWEQADKGKASERK